MISGHLFDHVCLRGRALTFRLTFTVMVLQGGGQPAAMEEDMATEQAFCDQNRWKKFHS